MGLISSCCGSAMDSDVRLWPFVSDNLLLPVELIGADMQGLTCLLYLTVSKQHMLAGEATEAMEVECFPLHPYCYIHGTPRDVSNDTNVVWLNSERNDSLLPPLTSPSSPWLPSTPSYFLSSTTFSRLPWTLFQDRFSPLILHHLFFLLRTACTTGM